MIERTTTYVNRTVLFSAFLCLLVSLTGCFEGSGNKSPKAENAATERDSSNELNLGNSQINQMDGAKATLTEQQNTLSKKKDECFVIKNKKLIRAMRYSYECWESGILKIPSGVEVIGEEAFPRGEKWRRFTQVIIPEGVKIIERYALPRLLKDRWQLRDSEKNTPNLIVLPNSLEEIHEGGLDNGIGDMTTVVRGLNNHPNLRIIGEHAFANLNIIGSLKIPPKLVKISFGAFRDNNFQHVEFPETIKSIGAFSFLNNKLTALNLPKQLETIEFAAFANNKITSLKLPEQLVEIQNGAFAYNSLKEVIFNEKLKKIGLAEPYTTYRPELGIYNGYTRGGVFFNNLLTKVVLPKSVEIVSDFAFMNNQISELILEKRDGLLRLGKKAFSNNQLTSIDFSDFYVSLGVDTFSSNKLKKVTFPIKSVTGWCRSFSDNPDLEKVSIPVTFGPFCKSWTEESLGKKLSVEHFVPIKEGPMVCPSDLEEDFIPVPGLKGFNQLDSFCVMRNQKDQVIREEALNYCQSLNQKYAGKLDGYEFDLISNYEWQIIAGNLTLHSKNWKHSKGPCKNAEDPCPLNPQRQMGLFDFTQTPILFNGEAIEGLYDSHEQWVKDLYTPEEMVASGLDFPKALIPGFEGLLERGVMRYTRNVIGSSDITKRGVLYHPRTIAPQLNDRILAKHFLNWGAAPYISNNIFQSHHSNLYNCHEIKGEPTCRMGAIYVSTILYDTVEDHSSGYRPADTVKMQVTRGGQRDREIKGPYTAGISLHSKKGKLSEAEDNIAGIRCVLRKK